MPPPLATAISITLISQTGTARCHRPASGARPHS
jgi:hypothetical protein